MPRGVGAGGRVTTLLSGAPHVVVCSPSAHFCWILKNTSTLPCSLHPRLGCGGCIWEHFPGSKVPGWLPGGPSTAPGAAPATALRPRWGHAAWAGLIPGLPSLWQERGNEQCVFLHPQPRTADAAPERLLARGPSPGRRLEEGRLSTGSPGSIFAFPSLSFDPQRHKAIGSD